MTSCVLQSVCFFVFYNAPSISLFTVSVKTTLLLPFIHLYTQQKFKHQYMQVSWFKYTHKFTLLKAVQEECRGQLWHSGDLGVQTVAPSSISAWLKSPGRLGSTDTLANCLKVTYL